MANLPIVWASPGPRTSADLANINVTIHAFEGHATTALCGLTTANPIDADLRIILTPPKFRRCEAILKSMTPRRHFGRQS